MQPVKPIENLIVFEGETYKVKLPDGRVAIVRETNGNDDELLSGATDADDNTNIHKFLAAITRIEGSDKVLTMQDIIDWKTNSKYYLVIKQRILIHGNIFLFRYTCDNDKCNKAETYEENIAGYDSNLTDPDAVRGPLAIWPYPNGEEKVIEFEISTGKRFQMDAMDGKAESLLRHIKDSDMNKNTQLRIRRLRQWIDNKWQLLTDFRGISSKEMTEVRNKVVELDSQFNPIVDFTCPYCSQKHRKHLFSLPGFLFPGEQ